MGLRITKLNANSGVAANIGATTAIFGATNLGIPISTTHAAATSVMGAGVSAGTGINRKKILEMVTAWISTVPAAAIVGFLMFQLTRPPAPWGWILSGAAIVVLLVWAGRLMIRAENADDVAEMLPSDTELHQYHTAPHPDLHEFEGPPPHISHYERAHPHEHRHQDK